MSDLLINYITIDLHRTKMNNIALVQLIFSFVKIKLPNSIINLNFHSKIMNFYFLLFRFQASIQRFILVILNESQSFI